VALGLPVQTHDGRGPSSKKDRTQEGHSQRWKRLRKQRKEKSTSIKDKSLCRKGLNFVAVRKKGKKRATETHEYPLPRTKKEGEEELDQIY